VPATEGVTTTASVKSSQRMGKFDTLANSAKRSPRHRVTLRSIITPSNGSYLAECVDLNLIVQRPTPEEAAESLESAMIGYIQSVLDNKQAKVELSETGQVAGLLPRKSPLKRRVRYHAYCLLAALMGSDRHFQLREDTSFKLAPCV
jgi:hypothetical protein